MKSLVAGVFLSLSIFPFNGQAEDKKPKRDIIVKILGYRPEYPEQPRNRQMNKLMKEDPRINIQSWGGISLPGGAGRSSMLMSIAGGTAPDIFYCWFHIIQNDIKQGFLHPLNEWIGEDKDGNGEVDPDEAIWEAWKKIPPLWRRVATKDGKIYGVPYAGTLLYGLIYRKDLVLEAGLNPEDPPDTWDEFFYWCQKMTFPKKEIAGARLKRGQRGMALGSAPWYWLPWMQAAGGSPTIQIKKSPKTGKEYTFPMDATKFIAPDTGEDLANVPSKWQANFDCPEGMEAASYYYKLRWSPWIKDAETNEPVNLTEEDIENGYVKVNDRTIEFTEDDVIRGVCRPIISRDDNMTEMLSRGEVAIIQYNVEDLETRAEHLGISPDLLGMMPIPAKSDKFKPVFQGHKHYWSMTNNVTSRSKIERDKVWEALKILVSEELRDMSIRQKVMSGGAMWCKPSDLKRLGMDDYIRDISPSLRKNYERVDQGKIYIGTEPFIGFWQSASDLLSSNFLSMIIAEEGQGFDYQKALKEVTHESNSGMMFELPSDALDKYRPTAWVLFILSVAFMVFCVIMIIRDRYKPKTGSTGAKVLRIIPWMMLLPALLSIGLWRYYPLARGALMAFQEYKIVGGTTWKGLDNFITVSIDPNFWLYVSITLKFVALTILIGFFTPIILALLLSEIPKGKITFRLFFFLPQMTSGIVVALLWKMMYDPTENGVLNQLLLAVGLSKQGWLTDPFWALACCILPGVWAAAGMSSLIYIAALHSFPDDLYEAAAIDGAGFMKRLRHITIPQLMPLIIINFVGTFIASFQNMGHIFLLTFGRPGKSTTVLGLAIWKLAYNDLRFSTATTMAWFLGVALIGFTYFQIRFMRRLEFRRAEEN